MLRVYACVVLVVCLCHVAVAQLDDDERPDEWEADNMPNPTRNPQHCRLGLQGGFVCDPDGIMSEKHKKIVDWLLRGFYDNDTACPCSAYWCEQVNKGTHMSVAVVKRLKVPEISDDRGTSVMQAASKFAFDLQDKNWNFGTCRNNMVLVYSREDQVLFISEGPTTRRVLRPEVVENIQRMYGGHFRKDGDLFTGLVEIILALRTSLNGNNYYDPNNPQQLVGGASHVIPGLLATAILAFCSMFLS